jgi:hypothetical protein
MAGGNTALLDQVRNFARDNAGFTAAGASEHQQWPIDVMHGLALAGIQSGHSGNRQQMRAGILARGCRFGRRKSQFSPPLHYFFVNI